MTNAFEPQHPGTDPIPQQSGSGKGCLIGCLLAGGFIVCAAICAGVGGYWFLSSQITKYTSETPIDLPTVEYSAEQLAELDSRVESFREKLNEGETPEQDLVLTADDINAMISKNKDLKGKVFVKIEDDQVKGDVSIPIDKLPGGKGRFFNGAASFDVSMDGGVLIVTVDQATLNGEPIPEAILESFRKENLAKDVYSKPENAKFMRQFEDIRIEDNRFVLRVKRDQDPNDQDAPASTPQSTPPAEADDAAGSGDPVESDQPTETAAELETAQ
ncbi:hypothetical protein NHH03_11230 [Stieleria sp. TO1_6]|uniref:hypothetical protein n=1 Tax=Stieleria tagensis TaxID=2956795 RepID=UPI00209B6F4E|nr:hypothetical protein [Stieleria tagensis]MCO8122313.1 hypothetical protein [Stieleria tagensis]